MGRACKKDGSGAWVAVCNVAVSMNWGHFPGCP